MIEVYTLDEDRNVQVVRWPEVTMTVLDGCLCLLTVDGEHMVAAYSEGTWITARAVE